MQNNQTLNKKIAVSIVVITYNHERYISQCLDSILAQNTNFNYEIIVHNDCSTDSTKTILDDYQLRYPDKIVVINQTKNQYSTGINNIISKYIVPCIKGDYVCYIDGDDYWCDLNKIQKQYSFLQKHTNYSMYFSAAYCIDEKTNKKSSWYNFHTNKTVKPKDIFCKRFGSIVPSSTIMVKREVFVAFPKWRLMYDVDDAPIFYLSAMNGKIYRCKKKTSVYRRNVDGSWTNSQNKASRLERSDYLEKIYEQMIRECDDIYHPFIIEMSKMNCIYTALLKRDLRTFFKNEYRSARKKVSLKTRIIFWLEYHFPKFIRNRR